MAKKNLAPFGQNKKTGQAVVTVANTVFTPSAPTNAALALLATGGPDDSLLKRVTAVPLQTITATQLQLFRQKVGGSLILWRTILMPAYNMTTSTAPVPTDFGLDPDAPSGLEAGEKLFAGIGVAAATGIAFTAELEDF